LLQLNERACGVPHRVLGQAMPSHEAQLKFSATDAS